MANTISQLDSANTFQHWLTATQGLIQRANLLSDGMGQTFYANTRMEFSGSNASLNVVTSATINDLHSNTINTVSLIVTGNLASANITGPAKVGTTLTVYDTTYLASGLLANGAITGNSTLDVTGNTTVHGIMNVVNSAIISGNTTIGGNVSIGGDLTVTGNIVLDSIGFDDLSVAGSGSFGNTLSVTGATTLSTANVTTLNASVNLTVSHNTTTDNLVVGNTATITGNSTIGGSLGVTGTITGSQLLGTANTQIYDAIAASAAESAAASIALSIALG